MNELKTFNNSLQANKTKAGLKFQDQYIEIKV